MNNRKRILKFCSDRNLTVKNLEWIRYTERIYGDSCNASYWELDLVINGEDFGYDTIWDSTESGILRMFEKIDRDIEDFMLKTK